ncbi:MAG: cytochrome c3 family protein, partial [Thermodesulfobacteriota bacterium]
MREFALSVAVLAASVGLFATVTFAGVADTNHNLGFYSPGSVKSPDTTEICIFCHTPHVADPTGPNWNKSDPGSTYTFTPGTSVVAIPGSPDGASKLCLSCHDGTVALGSLLNLPGFATGGTFPMDGTVAGKLSSASTTNLQTDLRDDHPISFSYDQSYPDNTEFNAPGSNNEFSPRSTPSDMMTVSLDSEGKVQCTSCHDAHNNVNGNFLVSPLEDAALCTYCHNKRYWTTIDGTGSVHYTSTANWDATGTNPWQMDLGSAGYTDDDPATHECLACHISHNGAAGMELTTGVNPVLPSEVGEEWTCLVCHTGTVAALDIEAEVDKTYGHGIKDATYYGRHTPSRGAAGEPAREDAVDLVRENQHAECVDCHNPHGAKSGNHIIGGLVIGDTTGNRIGPNMLGGWGVKPTSWPNLGVGGDNTVSPFGYSIIDFDSLTLAPEKFEGHMCIKCHSSYAYGVDPINRVEVPSGNGAGLLAYQEDITKSMNINNLGFHPVFGQGRNQPPSTANANWPAGGDGLSNTFAYV